MATRDLGVAVEDHVRGAGVSADNDLLADGHFAAGSLTRDDGDRRHRGDLSGCLLLCGTSRAAFSGAGGGALSSGHIGAI